MPPSTRPDQAPPGPGIPALAAAPTMPRFEHQSAADVVLGLGIPRPRLSWSVPCADPCHAQTAYEIEVARGDEKHTHRVEGSAQTLVPWPGPDLAARESVTARVRVAHGERWSAWSPPATAEAGLLSPSDWRASFISPVGLGAPDQPTPLLTGTLEIPGLVRSARLYATAHGVYEATLRRATARQAACAVGAAPRFGSRRARMEAAPRFGADAREWGQRRGSGADAGVRGQIVRPGARPAPTRTLRQHFCAAAPNILAPARKLVAPRTQDSRVANAAIGPSTPGAAA